MATNNRNSLKIKMLLAFCNFIKTLNKRMIRLKSEIYSIIYSQHQPSHIALAISLGIFIGIVIPFGFQTIVAIPLALIFRTNVLLTVIGTYVSNPITLIPLYTFIMNLGTRITGINLLTADIQNFLVTTSIEKIATIGLNGLTVFLTGSFVTAMFLSLIVFFLVKQLVTFLRFKQKSIY
jgi:uncharacterized protein (DUF2062 family)